MSKFVNTPAAGSRHPAGVCSIIISAILLWFAACGAHAATLVEDQAFTGASGSTHGDWVIQGTGAAFITATQADTSSGTVVQLTPPSGNQSGTAVYNKAFSSSLGVQVVFDYYIGGGTGADGLSFFLVDGTVASVTPGKSGGTLGYGTNYNTTSGVPNAYIAAGFDIYGNGRIEFGNVSGTAPNNGGSLPNNLLLVGSGNGTSGYRYLYGSAQATIGGGWRKADITLKRGDGINGCVSGGACISVRYSTDNGTSWTQVYTDQRIDDATGQVSIPDTFKLGFSGSTGGSTNNHYIDNAKIYFLRNGYQLDVSKIGSGPGTITSTSSPGQSTQINCGSTCSVAYLLNESVTLTATAAAGSAFTGWSGACSGTSASTTVTMDAAKSCVASFEAVYTVSTSAGTGGSFSPTSASVTQGSTTSFTVTPSTGYSINSVSGCGGSFSGNTYTTGAITGTCTVTASFSLNSYTVSTSAGTGGSISPTSASVTHGSTTSFTVTPDTGYSIISVSGCGGSFSGATYTTGAITGACTVTVSLISATGTRVRSGGGALGWLPLAGLLLLALRRRPRLATAAAALLLAVMPIMVQAEHGWYAGLQAGRASTDTDSAKVTQDINARGISGTASVSDSTRNAWKAYVGHEYNKYLGVEAGYTDLGKLTTNFNGVGLVTLNDLDGVLPVSGTGFELAAVGRYPLGGHFTGFGRIGLWHWGAQYELTDATGSVSKVTPTGTSAIFSLGVEASVRDGWSARLAWDRYRIDGADSDFLSIGAIYRFVR